MAFKPFFANGSYRIKSNSNNAYLTLDSLNSSQVVIAQQTHTNKSEWTISSAADGAYRITSTTDLGQALGIDDQGKVVCSTSSPGITWTIEPRLNDCVIGNAANELAVALPARGQESCNNHSHLNGATDTGLVFQVSVATRNNRLRQRWVLELVSLAPGEDQASVEGGSDHKSTEEANATQWNHFRIDSNYTLILGNGHNSDWDHVYVATSGVGYYGRVMDAQGPFHRSRVRNLANLSHTKVIELFSNGPIWTSSPANVNFSRLPARNEAITPAVAPTEWNVFRIDSNYTLILGNGHNSDWDHVYVATSGVGYYGWVMDAQGPFHRSRVRNLRNLTHTKVIELFSNGPIFTNSPENVYFSRIS